jgi:hypothetical protein
MCRRVVLVRTEVSEDHIASIFKVTRISELGTTLAVTSNRITLRRNTMVTLMMEAIRSSKMSVLKRITRRRIPEDIILHVVTCLSTVVQRMLHVCFVPWANMH